MSRPDVVLAVVPSDRLEQFLRTLGQSGGAFAYATSLRLAREQCESFKDCSIVEVDRERCTAEVIP